METSIKEVAVTLKANIYFDGGVVSHSLLLKDGVKKTVGLIRPGSYHFTTDAPERMDIIAGECRIKLVGEKTFRAVHAGSHFDVPGKSAFDIAVDKGLVEYLCSFGN